MTEELDINFDSAYISPFKPLSWRKVGTIIRRIGFAVSLFQLLLGVGSMLLFLLAMVNRGRMTSLGVDLSLFCVWCGLIFLTISIYTAFSYAGIAGKLIKTGILSSEKTLIVKKLKIATMISSAGALVSFIGVEIILGVMLSKVTALEPGILFYDRTRFPNSFVTFSHVLSISATANLMAAHCAGLVGSLWALKRIEKINY